MPQSMLVTTILLFTLQPELTRQAYTNILYKKMTWPVGKYGRPVRLLCRGQEGVSLGVKLKIQFMVDAVYAQSWVQH